MNASLSAYDHTSTNAPETIRTRKLNVLGLVQYWGGGPPGNNKCCMHFYFFINIIILTMTLKRKPAKAGIPVTEPKKQIRTQQRYCVDCSPPPPGHTSASNIVTYIVLYYIRQRDCCSAYYIIYFLQKIDFLQKIYSH